MQLWIGNLPYTTTDEDVREAFSLQGVELTELRLICDRETGASKGYAFAELKNPDEAADVIARMNRTIRIGGRLVVISPANDKRQGSSPRPNADRGQGGRPR
jgi:RNA recognition motif-containing protein